MQTIRNTIDGITEKALAFLMGLMTINVLWQIATRFIFGNPSSFTEELARFLLIWISVLGTAYLTGKMGHIAIDYIPQKLSESRQKRVQVFVDVLIMLFAAAVMVIGGSNLVYITLHLGQDSSALHVPLGYIYAIVPVSGLFIIFYSVHNLLK